MATMRETPCDVVIRWAESIGWPVMMPKRGWAAFKSWVGFECSPGAGFSGAAKLQAAFAALRQRRECGELERWRHRTIGDLLDEAAANGEPMGSLPLSRQAWLMGRPDIARSAAALGL